MAQKLHVVVFVVQVKGHIALETAERVMPEPWPEGIEDERPHDRHRREREEPAPS